jgi:hypothetical protein
MTTAVLAQRRTPPYELLRKLAVLALFMIGAVVTAAGAVVGNGNPVFAVAPILAVVVAYAVYVSPVRYVLFSLIFLCLTLDAAGEGAWDSPLAKVGGPLLYNLNKVIPISALAFPGYAAMMFVALALLIHRSLANIPTDDDRGSIPKPLIGAMAVGVATAFVLVFLGISRGGNTQMAKIQVQGYLFMLLFAYLCSMSFRGIADYRIIGRLIVAAAVYRTVYVAYVYHFVAPRLGGGILNVAATHGDSLLFATATVLLVVRFLEKPSARTAAWCAGILPILILGMQWNNRRIVWVELACGMLIYILVSRASRLKRLLAYGVLLALPLLVAYVAVGWNSQSKVFAPIKMYRSVTDGKVDSSTLYRDLENFNLLMTMRMYPLTGTGFGQPFLEDVRLPDISVLFKEYRYMPHNSILGLWAFTGPMGFWGLWLAAGVGAYFAARSYRLAGTADERVAALMVIATLAIYMSHCWGDIGFSELRTIFLAGPALAIGGQLACATGAWRLRQGRNA